MYYKRVTYSSGSHEPGLRDRPARSRSRVGPSLHHSVSSGRNAVRLSARASCSIRPKAAPRREWFAPSQCNVIRSEGDVQGPKRLPQGGSHAAPGAVGVLEVTSDWGTTCGCGQRLLRPAHSAVTLRPIARSAHLRSGTTNVVLREPVCRSVRLRTLGSEAVQEIVESATAPRALQRVRSSCGLVTVRPRSASGSRVNAENEGGPLITCSLRRAGPFEGQEVRRRKRSPSQPSSGKPPPQRRLHTLAEKRFMGLPTCSRVQDAPSPHAVGSFFDRRRPHGWDCPVDDSGWGVGDGKAQSGTGVPDHVPDRCPPHARSPRRSCRQGRRTRG